jgi:3-oxoacyl-[acyl-carrier protein] reductase
MRHQDRDHAMTRLAGKVALVTHAGNGIGAAVARRLAAEGACVVVSHTNDREGATRLVADIVWRGGCAIAVQGDVAHWPDVRRLFEETAATFGRLDILVNDARAAAPAADDTRRRDEINLFGAMLMCQEAIRLFGRDGGAIINLTTLARCDLAPDVAPETAIDTLTLGLARALSGRNIRVHAIAPGALGPQEPAEIDVLDGEARSRQFVALPRRTSPDAVAKLAADLACDNGCTPLMAAS